jgi:indole-3-glycerol phosphate synthase
MNILDEIIAFKYKEVGQRKLNCTISGLEKSKYFQRETISLKNSILDSSKSGIIAEFKRKSPSKGIINNSVTVEKVTTGYANYGASGLSVLTDEIFFGGSNADLSNARECNSIPILRKDFVVDEYQIVEAKSIGADAILLIAACLSADQIKKLSKFAKSLSLEILLELHSEDEFDEIYHEVDLIGINNRNLKTFKVDIEQSKRYAAIIPNTFVKIAESGINSVEVIKDLKTHGFKGFLIGELFMQSIDPVETFENFVNELHN